MASNTQTTYYFENNHLQDLPEKDSQMQETTFFSELDDPAEILKFRILDQNGRISIESIKSALKPPYPLKYYLSVVFTSIGATIFLLWNFGVIQGTKLGFFCNDPLFSHKYTGDTVTPVMLGVGAALLFILLYFLVEYVRQGRFKGAFNQQSLFGFYLHFKQLIIGLILVLGFTEIAKTIVGEHRPHFFDTCMPDTNFNCINGTYISSFTCTNPDVTYLQLIDSSRSFPSGHSSASWFVSLFTAYVVHRRLPVKRTGIIFKTLMLTVCLTFGLMSSLTRITDRRHHWWDVLIGTIIGIIGTIYMIRVTDTQITLLREQTRIIEENGRIRRRDTELEDV